MRRIRSLLHISLFCSTIVGSCYAGLFRVQSDTLFSTRNNSNLNIELPAYEFFQGSYISSNHHFEFDTHFGFSRQHNENSSLYILKAKYSPADFVSIRGGRSLDVRTYLKTLATDSAEVDFSLFNHQVTLGVLGGIERQVLRARLRTATQFMGGHLDFRHPGTSPFFIRTQYVLRKPKINQNHVNQHVLSASAHQTLNTLWSPELIGNLDYTLGKPHKRLNQAELGVDAFPTYQSAFRIRALTYDRRAGEDVEDPIFAIFSLGRLYEVSAQFEYQLARPLTVSVSAAYDNYLLQHGDRTSGERIEVGLNYSEEFWKIMNSLYYFHSYGGRVYGGRVRVTHRFSDIVSADWVSDVTYYRKITDSRTFAYNNAGSVGLTFLKNFRFNTGLEMNSNNSVRYDFRYFAKLTYLLWSEL